MVSLLAAAASLALAQAEVPSWAEEPPPRLPGSMRLTLDRYRYFTDCLAGREWVTVRPLFDLAIGSREETARLRTITGGLRGTECSYADEMSMTRMLMRGGIAESRYRLVYGDEPLPPAAEAPAPVLAGASFAWVDFGRESSARVLRGFASCLADREPAASRAVLSARIDRREEREAWRALSRRFGACLAPGQRLRANSLTLRPWLGEAMYQQARGRRPDGDP